MAITSPVHSSVKSRAEWRRGFSPIGDGDCSVAFCGIARLRKALKSGLLGLSVIQGEVMRSKLRVRNR